jgi:hypothetical protein
LRTPTHFFTQVFSKKKKSVKNLKDSLTESVMDLGKALAMPVVVFNCSDALDHKMMQQFFLGLAQAGAS